MTGEQAMRKKREPHEERKPEGYMSEFVAQRAKTQKRPKRKQRRD